MNFRILAAAAPAAASFLALSMFAGDLAAQHVRHGALRPADRERLEALGDVARDWVVDTLPDGAVSRIRGRLSLAPAQPAVMAAEFIKTHGAYFDVPAGMEYEVGTVGGTGKNGKARYIRIQQMIRGFLAEGYGITLALDSQGAAVGAHGVVARALAHVQDPKFTDVDAVVFAKAALHAAGIDESALKEGAGGTSRIARIDGGRVQLVYRVDVVLKATYAALGVDVDAVTGRVIDIRTRSYSCAGAGGHGNYTFNDQTTVFNTTKGKGNAYSSVANALKMKHQIRTLPDLGNDDIAGTPAVKGVLYGRYIQSFDQFGNDAFSSNNAFTFNSNDPAVADLFDQVNIYYWIETIATNYAKLFGPLPTDRTLPVVVNIPALENAFFSPAELVPGFPGGFMAFGDPSQQTGDVMDDYSRDMTVAGHEYLHAVVDGFLLNFGNSDIDNPPRAVNEAIADFFPASMFNDPRIGPIIAFFHFGPDLALNGESLRNLTEERVAPNDLSAFLGQSGLPEEHEAGLIFGASLWRLRTAIKKNISDPLLASSLPNWPQTTAEVGFPAVDTNNAEAAYTAYFFACLEALVDDLLATKGFTTAAKGLGALMANGAIGNFDTGTMYQINALGGLNLSMDSRFLEFVDNHGLDFQLKAGQKIDVTITGNAQDHTAVDFDIQNPGVNFTFPNAKTVTGNNSKVAQKQITVVNDGTYTFAFRNVGAGPGRYKLQIKVSN